MSTIYKLILISLTLLSLTCWSYGLVLAVPVLEDDKSISIDYSKFDTGKLKISAKNYFDMALKEPDKQVKQKYLKQAATEYYILSNTDKDDINNYIALGRIYGMRGIDRYAKAYFYNALGIDYKNPSANFYFAEYFYSKKNYKLALDYYKHAFQYGYPQNAETLQKIGYIYERYGDIARAVTYYKKSTAMKSNPELSKKIQEMDGVNYASADYNSKKLR